MAGQRGYAAGRVLGMLFRRSAEMAKKQFPDYDLADAIDLENRAKAAIPGPQSELFPFEKRKPAAFQLQLPLTGGYWWGLVGRPTVGKPVE
jgi:hypothetical protein